jgi:hypothetical protein
MTQPVIKKFNENSCMSMLAKLYSHPNCKRLAQAVQLNRGNPADHHSPCSDCGLGTRGPGPLIAASYLQFAQLQPKSTSKKEKHGKNIVSVMESVLLILLC